MFTGLKNISEFGFTEKNVVQDGIIYILQVFQRDLFLCTSCHFKHCSFETLNLTLIKTPIRYFFVYFSALLLVL